MEIKKLLLKLLESFFKHDCKNCLGCSQKDNHIKIAYKERKD